MSSVSETFPSPSPVVEGIALTTAGPSVLYKIGSESILAFLHDREAYEGIILARKKAGCHTEPLFLKPFTY